MPAVLILIPLTSSVILWLTRGRSARASWGLALALSLLLEFAVAGSFWGIPGSFRLSTWRPSAVFSSEIVLLLDEESWAMVLAAASIYLTILLTAPTRPGSSSSGTRSFGLAYLALGMAALMSGNLLTVIITWISADSIAFIYLLRQAQSEMAVVGLRRRFFLQIASSLVVLMASVIPSTLPDPVGRTLSALLIALAVLLRVGLWPLHISLPMLPGVRRGMGALVRLLPVAMGLSFLGRQFPVATSPTTQIALLLFGGMSTLAGGIQWLAAREALSNRPYLVLTGAGMAVAAAGLGGDIGRPVIAVGATVVLFGMLLSSLQLFSREHRWLGRIAILAMIGFPFFPMHLLFRVFALQGGGLGLEVGLTLLVGMLSLGIGGFGLAWEEQATWGETETFARRVYSIGLVVPMLASLAIGIAMESRPSLLSSAVYSIVAGSAWLIAANLTRHRPRLLQIGPRWLEDIGADLAQAVLGRAAVLAEGIASAIRLLSRAIEGRASMLWVYVVVLLLVMLSVANGGAL